MHYIVGLLLLCISTVSYAQIQPEPPSGSAVKQVVTAKEYMVVAANPHAVKAGKQIIEQGGNAIDAAIAVQMVLNVVEPQSSGIGGGGFLLRYDNEDKRVVAYDGRETAPLAISPAAFQDKNGKPIGFLDAVQGGRSVGVPGLLKMLKSAHDKHGKLPWELLFQPAIKIAEEGFALSPRLHKVLSYVDYMPKFKEASALFLDEEGNIKPVGAWITNKPLAKTFRTLAKKGIAPFYEGEIAEKIVDTVQNTTINPSVLSMEDLQNYTSKSSPALCGGYKEYAVCGALPPSSGGVAILQALGIMQHKKNVFNVSLDVRTIHLLAEVTKVVFADRNAYIADPDFVEMPINNMLDATYLAERAQMIRDDKAIKRALPGDFATHYAMYDNGYEIPSTTHISIADKQGNVISMTSSVEHAFGSLLMVDGFFLNNQLTDFAFVGEKEGEKIANRIEAKKRPRSSMSPTIILDDKNEFMMAVGSPGGARIIPYVVQVILAVLEGGMSLQEAVELPHVVNLNREVLELEKGYFSKENTDALATMGHVIKERELNSGLHAIMYRDEQYVSGVDPRREGIALGK